MKIWEKMLLKDTIKHFLFFLLALYFFYIAIDFSSHSQYLFVYKKLKFLEIPFYYLNCFVKYLEFFIPLTLLLAIEKVLLTLNLSNEITSLRMAGLSSREISRPFIKVALFLVLFLYLNEEFFSPYSSEYIYNFKEHNLRHQPHKKENLNVLLLKDSTKLIFHSPEKRVLYDVFWVKSPHDIWHIKKLNLANTTPEGFYVEHLSRNSRDFFEKKESFRRYFFYEMDLTSATKNNLETFENMPISLLVKKFCLKQFLSERKKADLLSQLHYKIAEPLFPLLVVLIVFPFCLRFSRTLPIFFIIALSIFGLVLFFTLIDSTLILSENQALSPLVAIWLPIIMLFTVGAWRFATS